MDRLYRLISTCALRYKLADTLCPAAARRMAAQSADNLVWLDMEATTLDYDVTRLLEVSM